MKEMKKEIIIEGVRFFCKLKKHQQARNVTITLNKKGLISLTMPKGLSYQRGFGFVLKNQKWILEKFQNLQFKKDRLLEQGSREDYLDKKRLARKIIKEKIERLNKFYGFKYNRIFIRNQSSRWGSCSSRKNLNFNYRIVYLPDHLADYLIVHELCHLAQLNHSTDFWRLVSQTIPDCKKLSKELRQI